MKDKIAKTKVNGKVSLPTKKKPIKYFSCKLWEVRELLFTCKSSPFYYMPNNSKILELLKNYPIGTPINILGYKMSKDSHFIRVIKVYINKNYKF